MKKHKPIAVFGTLALSITAATALPIAEVSTIGGYGAYQTGSGGEFTLEITSAETGSGIVSGTGAGSTWLLYDDKTRNQVSGFQSNFQTFCVEGSERLAWNTKFDATTGSNTLSEGKVLTVGAAWLYWQFATGQLSGYNYGNNRTTTAGALQKTLWWLMGTAGYTKQISENPNNLFSSLVMNTYGNGSAMFEPNAGQYDVSILRLWNDSDNGMEEIKNGFQDVLVLTNPVPDTGLTVTLLGVAMTGMAMIRRRIRPIA